MCSQDPSVTSTCICTATRSRSDQYPGIPYYNWGKLLVKMFSLSLPFENFVQRSEIDREHWIFTLKKFINEVKDVAPKREKAVHKLQIGVSFIEYKIGLFNSYLEWVCLSSSWIDNKRLPGNCYWNCLVNTWVDHSNYPGDRENDIE